MNYRPFGLRTRPRNAVDFASRFIEGGQEIKRAFPEKLPLELLVSCSTTTKY
jgi:hypothetical protein